MAEAVLGKRYIVYLVLVALAGWALASYDVNLLVLALPDIAKSLHISETGIGILGFFVYGAQFCITIFAGYSMDRFGRRRVWMICLAGTAIFTGLTYFVQDFWQLVAVRALASGLAYSELAVSITIVNEQVPAKGRGFLYSIVQGGWPLGLFFASGVYLAFGHMGWRFVFLLGVIPIVGVIVGRIFVRESDRYEHVQQVRDAHAKGDDGRLQALLAERAVATDEMERVTIGQLFAASPEIRRQLIWLTFAWICYGASYVASNFYITYWLTKFKGFSSSEASTLLLVTGGIGFFFYILGGWMGERVGRREVIIVTALLVAPLSLIFLYAHQTWLVVIVYFLLYQVTNGTWASAGYAYQAESFPTRMRGTAVGFLSAMQVLGFVIGTLLWTLLSDKTTPTVTWLVLAVGVSIGMCAVIFLRHIKPNQELEAISQ
ncbi:MFS transporter [Acidisoma silvae]|uniref:MFS transporter n=1 Tax=Acidisoma silvae TaxID=2802396 RepID=A0A963YQT5_9PROT|nr:MFS transporter [Acidisoma silvae]MCB8875257.1 MFS transporter [Acidisoma silvae]